MSIKSQVELITLRAGIEALKEKLERIKNAFHNQEIAYWEYVMASSHLETEIETLEQALFNANALEYLDYECSNKPDPEEYYMDWSQEDLKNECDLNALESQSSE